MNDGLEQGVANPEPSELNLWTRQWRAERIGKARADYRAHEAAYSCLEDKSTYYALSIKRVRDVCAQVLALWEASPPNLTDELPAIPPVKAQGEATGAGWRMVPPEPTPKMLFEADKILAGEPRILSALYRAMISAALPPVAGAVKYQRAAYLLAHPLELEAFVIAAEKNADDWLALNRELSERPPVAGAAGTVGEASARICESLIPQNDVSDWTEYAIIRAEAFTEAAKHIRATLPPTPPAAGTVPIEAGGGVGVAPACMGQARFCQQHPVCAERCALGVRGMEAPDLRAVLEPFAKAAERFDGDHSAHWHDDVELWQVNWPLPVYRINAGDLRRAREAFRALGVAAGDGGACTMTSNGANHDEHAHLPNLRPLGSEVSGEQGVGGLYADQRAHGRGLHSPDADRDQPADPGVRPERQGDANAAHGGRLRLHGLEGTLGVTPASAPPAMPDDYWLHVRGCDCAYCAWERSNAGVAACELGRPWEPVSYGPGCWAVGRRVGNAIERHNLQAPYMTHSEALSIASGLNAGVSPSASRTNDDHTPTGKDQ